MFVGQRIVYIAIIYNNLVSDKDAKSSKLVSFDLSMMMLCLYLKNVNFERRFIFLYNFIINCPILTEEDFNYFFLGPELYKFWYTSNL